MLKDIDLLCHSSIKISKDKIMYIDPFEIENEFYDADIIFCTHSHYDHFSEEDILKIKNKNTKLVITEDCIMKAISIGFDRDNIIIVEPNCKYNVYGVEFETINAYNNEKQYHPKENGWVGYILNINGIKYYIAGDTDITSENKNIQCDVAFLPIGGIYTMNFKEAASLANTIMPKIVIPTHYGNIVGKVEDAINFKKLLKESIECKIYI